VIILWCLQAAARRRDKGRKLSREEKSGVRTDVDEKRKGGGPALSWRSQRKKEPRGDNQVTSPICWMVKVEQRIKSYPLRGEREEGGRLLP